MEQLPQRETPVLKPGGPRLYWLLATSGSLFLAILLDVIFSGMLSSRLDPSIQAAVATGPGPVHDLARGVSILGHFIGITLVTAAGVGYLIHRRHTMEAFFLAWAVLAGALWVMFLKAAIDRARPSALPSDALDAFPSGHAADVTFAWGLVLLLCLHEHYRSPAGIKYAGTEATGYKVAWGMAGIVAFVVGLSRIVLDLHWFTDVLAGWMFGLFWTAIVMGFRFLWIRDWQDAPDATPAP